jgi:hypothetical protein
MKHMRHMLAPCTYVDYKLSLVRIRDVKLRLIRIGLEEKAHADI